MEFHEPRSVSEAIALLAENDEAICLAGGASLVAMMNARLVEPEELVSLRYIEEITGILPDRDGSVRIGAMTTHERIADYSGFRGGQSVIALAASRIGHPAIRAMGTIGGAVSLADPAADYPPALIACGARIEIAASAENHDVAAEDFFRGYFDTALKPGEIVTAVSVPAAVPNSGASFLKFARVEGDYATVSVAAVVEFEGEICSQARIAVGACGPVPTRVPDAEAGLIGTRLEPEALANACSEIAEACNPVDDVRGTAGYRRKIIPELIRRAVHDARSKIGRAP
jgi:carbon-monoxide dehydrogenase medium subunit